MKCSLNLTSSKRNLKTYLFKRYFNLLFCSCIFRIYYLLSYSFKHFIVERLRALEYGATKSLYYYYYYYY